jgi:2-polyprenyl-3-methyl-5-hydroxy-6-metoxy-1,4-benzoquinol methylase
MTLTREAWDQVRELNRKEGFRLGPINAQSLVQDPKHLAFVLSRYKFAARMLRRCASVVEVGCGEGLGALMFLAETRARFTALDFDEAQVAYTRAQVLPRVQDPGRLRVEPADLVTQDPPGGPYDGLVCLDVIEHVHGEDQEDFLAHASRALVPGALAVWGTPSLHAGAYASERSRVGHINLFDPERFGMTLERHFRHVLPFSMNDELVHTGFANMAHYLLAVCVK